MEKTGCEFLVVAAALAAGCSVEAETRVDLAEGAVDIRPVVRAAETPPPIYGGTLEVLDDRQLAVVSDPARDRVYVVSTSRMELLHSIALEDGDTPWRIAEDQDGRVHVVLRGSGVLATIDPEVGEVVARRKLCPNPRGVSADGEVLWVACASGRLLEVESEPEGKTRIHATTANDLRDIIAYPSKLIATRFRSAQLVAVARDPVDDAPPIAPFPLVTLRGDIDDVVPAVAWRTRRARDSWFMVHQYATDGSVPGEVINPWDGGRADPCDTPVTAALTVFDMEGPRLQSRPLRDVVLPVDAAASPDGSWYAIASAGNPERNLVALRWASLESNKRDAECGEPDAAASLPGSIVGVDFTADDRVLAVTREPAKLYRLTENFEIVGELALDDESVEDTGHTLFHIAAGDRGLACASCHPEGGDDGLVWNPETTRARRTQPLNAILAGTAPFHWEGDLENFGAIIDDVYAEGMGGMPQSPQRAAAFEDWVLSIPAPNPVRNANDEAAVRGAAAFVEFGCDTCHHGASTTQASSVTLADGIALQVPSLIGVATRGPFMHDARSPTLFEAVVDMFAKPGGARPPDATINDLVAYLETL